MVPGLLLTLIALVLSLVPSSIIGSFEHSDDSVDKVPIVFHHNLLKSKAPSHCGVYSLLAVANALGVDADVQTLLVEEYVSSEYGSSALDLKRAADHLGLKPEMKKRLSIAALRNSSSPILIHLQLIPNSQCGHWVAYLGESEGQARIFDPMSDMRKVPFGMVLAKWNGVGIVVQNQATPTEHSASAYLFWLSWLLVPLGALILLKPFVANHPFTRPNFLLGCLGILAATNVWLFLDVLANDTNTLRNSETALLASCLSRINPDDRSCDRIGDNEIDNFVKNRQGLLVDARPFRHFANGSLPFAVNIPVDSTMFDFIEHCESLNRQQPVVVYCLNSKCQWDELVAQRLRCMGFDHVRVYEHGLVGFGELTEGQK